MTRSLRFSRPPAFFRRLAASAILADLGVLSVRLMTNNPLKVSKLRELGVEITGRIPVLIEPNEHSHGYLTAKADRMGHLIDAEHLAAEQAG